MSSASIPENSPVGTPIRLPGYISHNRLMTALSVGAALNPPGQAGALLSPHGNDGMPCVARKVAISAALCVRWPTAYFAPGTVLFSIGQGNAARAAIHS